MVLIGRIFRFSIMLRALVLGLPIMLLVGSCTNLRSKKHHFDTITPCDGIYIEKFTVFSGGAYSAEVYSDYLTDSVTFRKYVGSHNDEQKFIYDCRENNLIHVEKIAVTGGDTNKILESRTFDIRKLKMQKVFE
jgi:hypothetical protein